MVCNLKRLEPVRRWAKENPTKSPFSINRRKFDMSFARISHSVCVLVVTVGPLAFAGCASITGSTDQTVSVDARDQQTQVTGASCELDNDKGKWFVSAPGSTRIARSNEDLVVTCQKDGLDPGVVVVESQTKGSMAGNILFGGLIGAAIDHSSGAAYEYPTLIQVLMGQSQAIKTPSVRTETAGDDSSAGLQ
jgi:hypothetical protein